MITFASRPLLEFGAMSAKSVWMASGRRLLKVWSNDVKAFAKDEEFAKINKVVAEIANKMSYFNPGVGKDGTEGLPDVVLRTWPMRRCWNWNRSTELKKRQETGKLQKKKNCPAPLKIHREGFSRSFCRTQQIPWKVWKHGPPKQKIFINRVNKVSMVHYLLISKSRMQIRSKPSKPSRTYFCKHDSLSRASGRSSFRGCPRRRLCWPRMTCRRDTMRRRKTVIPVVLTLLRPRLMCVFLNF